MSKLVFVLLAIFFVAFMGTQLVAAARGQGGGQGNGKF